MYTKNISIDSRFYYGYLGRLDFCLKRLGLPEYPKVISEGPLGAELSVVMKFDKHCGVIYLEFNNRLDLCDHKWSRIANRDALTILVDYLFGKNNSVGSFDDMIDRLTDLIESY
jgi:hypothetical protein